MSRADIMLAGNKPLTIALDVSGRSLSGPRFHVSINSAGDVSIDLGGYMENQKRLVRSHQKTLSIPNESRSAIRRAVGDSDFFTLPDTIGYMTPDGKEVVLTVVLGDLTHTVRVHASSLHPDKISADDQITRFSRLYQEIVDSIEGADPHIPLMQVPTLQLLDN